MVNELLLCGNEKNKSRPIYAFFHLLCNMVSSLTSLIPMSKIIFHICHVSHENYTPFREKQNFQNQNGYI